MRSIVVASCIMLIGLAGCASSPKVSDPSGVDISVEKLTPGQALMSFGSLPRDPNPYRTQGGAIMGFPNELIVLRFTIVAAQKAMVTINSITALDSKGTSVAKYYYIDEYSSYIGTWQSAVTAQMVQKVQDTYVPGDSFTVLPGHHTYYAVLLGKNPIPRPFQVSVDASADDGQSRVFSFDVTK